MVEDALPRAIADTLLAEMPPLNVLLQDQDPGSNVRFPLPSPLALGNPKISDAWKDALRACLDASQDFLDRTRNRLGGHLLGVFPDFETRFGPINELRAVPRYGPMARNEVGVDAQIVVNSPPLADAPIPQAIALVPFAGGGLQIRRGAVFLASQSRHG